MIKSFKTNSNCLGFLDFLDKEPLSAMSFDWSEAPDLFATDASVFTATFLVAFLVVFLVVFLVAFFVVVFLVVAFLAIVFLVVAFLAVVFLVVAFFVVFLAAVIFSFFCNFFLYHFYDACFVNDSATLLGNSAYLVNSIV